MIAHPLVQQVVDDYLTIIDLQAPRLVEALYLVGSTALDDFQPGRSDVDFIAVSRNGLSVADFAAIKRAHAQLRRQHRRPQFDGSYVTWRELAQDPDRSGRGAEVYHGKPEFPASRGRSPLAWLVLSTAGIAVRGPRRQEVNIWADRTVLRTWARDRLLDHWRTWRERSAKPLTRHSLACLGSTSPTHAVLRTSQLHHVLTTGRVISKTSAGRYALETFGPRWHRLIGDCLRVRLGGGGSTEYRNPLTRRGNLDSWRPSSHRLTPRWPGEAALGPIGHAGRHG
jgi:hypothetical protein